jgi:hypothetical protein
VGERRYRYELEKDWRKLESMMEILHLRKFEEKTGDNPLPSIENIVFFVHLFIYLF